MPEVKEVRLANGFRALLVERHTLPVVACTLWYRVGSRDERTGETGLSHFLEHMMFKGTKRFGKGAIDLLTTKMGGSNNAFTGHDATAYYFSLPADRWETALEIEASRMRDCLLDPSEFEREKKVVLDELAMGEDNPWHRLDHALEGTAYHVHPYHHPIIGWKEDVERLTVEGMRGYYGRHYAPNRSFLVIVGDIKPRRIARRIRELFGDIEPSEFQRAKVLSEPEQKGERRARLLGGTSIARLMMSFPSCRMGERDDFISDVLVHALGSSRSSRLHRRLVVGERLCTYVNAHNDVRLDPGLLWIAAELVEGAEGDRVEHVIREEMDNLARSALPAAELRRIRTQLNSSFLFEDETVLDQALKIGRFEAQAVGGYRLLEQVVPTYESINGRDVASLARRVLSPDMATVAWSLPEADAARGKTGVKARKKKAAVKR